MKKTLLMLMLASMLAMSAHSQTLQNTYWHAYNVNNTPGLYFYFGQDTISVGFNNSSYSIEHLYATNGNTFTIEDYPSPNCGMNYIGSYTFMFTPDTLWFTVISDTCSMRQNYFSYHYFLQLNTGTEELNGFSGATISPNPSADGIFNLMFNENGTMPNKIYVMAADGRKILDENILSGATNHTINIQSRASGIYFLVTENEKGRRVYKLVR